MKTRLQPLTFICTIGFRMVIYHLTKVNTDAGQCSLTSESTDPHTFAQSRVLLRQTFLVGVKCACFILN